MLGEICQRYSLLALSMVHLVAMAQEEAQQATFTMTDTRTELAGRWHGELQYRDYQSNQWFGIPVTVDMESIDDGATIIRKAHFDDGNAGTVHITIVSMLAPDGETEYVGSFRADRPAELISRTLRLAGTTTEMAPTAIHWTVIAETDGEDDNRPARIRETTTRTGPKLVTLKEVDFSDDNKEEWLQRNRTVLNRVRQ